MLYLNLRWAVPDIVFPVNLTLTSVVFEYARRIKMQYEKLDLTLTSVVFE